MDDEGRARTGQKADRGLSHKQQDVAPCTSRSTPALLAATPLLRPGSVRDRTPNPTQSKQARRGCHPNTGRRLSKRQRQPCNEPRQRRHSNANMQDKQTTGPRRPSAERPPVPAACDPSPASPGASRTASRSAPPRAPAVPRSNKCFQACGTDGTSRFLKGPRGEMSKMAYRAGDIIHTQF